MKPEIFIKLFKIWIPVILILLLPGCFQEEPGQIETSDEVIVTPPGTLPIVNEPLTLTGFIPSVGLIEDISTNAVMQRVEEDTNIKIEWIESSKIDARNKLRILLASSDYPDIIQGTNGSGLSGQDLVRYGTQGIFIPLNSLIEEYGKNIKELFETHPFVKDAITASDGNIYGLPAVFTDDYHMTMRQKLWINRFWLENLNLDMPTTTEEFFDVLIAFRDYDANANGDPSDEIPLTGAKRSLENVAMWIMNSFIPAGGTDDSGDAQLNNFEFIINNDVVFTADKEEFREGLRYIRRLYAEKLIDIAALTQDRDQITPLVDGGNALRVGAVASHHPGNFAGINDEPDARFRQYIALPPLTGPGGQRNTPWFIDAIIESGQFVITNTCEYPEAAIRLADYYYSMEYAEVEKGIEGVHWRRVDEDEGLKSITGGTAKYEYLMTLKTEDNAQVNMGPVWTRNLKNEFARSDKYSYEEMLYDATLLYDDAKVARFPYSTIALEPSELDEFDYLRRTIHSFVGESVNRFILGDLDIDLQWEEYLRQLDRIGLARYMEIIKDAYNRYENN